MKILGKFESAFLVFCLLVTSVVWAVEANDKEGEATAPKEILTHLIKAKEPTFEQKMGKVLADYSGKVEFDVKGNVVYLSGELPSQADFEKVIILAASTPGVEDVVVSALKVQGEHDSLKDAYLISKIKGALIQSKALSKDLSSWTIRFVSKNNEIQILGTVPSLKQKKDILDIVNSVPGAEHVVLKLNVRP